MLERKFSEFSITITVWDKCKFLLHCHHYAKGNVWDFLVSEFSRQLYNVPTNVMKASWAHCKVWKNFGPIFSSVKCFGKCLEITSLDNVQRQWARYVLLKSFFENVAKFTRKHLCRSLFFNRVEAKVFYSTHVNNCFWTYSDLKGKSTLKWRSTLLKSVNMGIWVVGISNQLFIRGS